MTETKTETKTTYGTEHEARIAVTNALLLPNITRVWWNYRYWEKDAGGKPYEVTVETVLRQVDYQASDFRDTVSKADRMVAFAPPDGDLSGREF